MEKAALRIKIISLKNSAKKNVNKALFYIKKLKELSSNNGDTVILEPNGLTTDFVCSLNDTFNWHINDGNYCEIIFLMPRFIYITDTILWFNHLSSLLSNSTSNTKASSKLHHSMILTGDYHLEISLQFIDDSTGYIPLPVTQSLQLIRGHTMQLKRFNNRVHCALCEGFISAPDQEGSQGFQCSNCSLVTHIRCHQDIPFWCQKSIFANKKTIPLYENVRLTFHIPHSFKHYDLPWIRPLAPSIHCNHCGIQVSRHALKCTQCNFIIHHDCRANVPAMCTIPYSTISKILVKCSPKPAVVSCNKRHSTSSSIGFRTLGPLPEFRLENQRRISLPNFNDFEYIGRLGVGAFAQVYCVQHILSKQYFAIKVADGEDEQARLQLEVEKQILFRYSYGNPYMIKAYCAFHHGSKLFLVMELVQGGTLCHKIQRERMNEDDIRFYLAQIISVLQYLHSKHIVYRDLKLEHAIVSSTGSLRLIDYGLGRLLQSSDEMCHTFCGTYSYMAPEVRCLEKSTSKEGYSYAVDFWALGIMFVQMLWGEQIDVYHPIDPNSNIETNESKHTAQNLELPRYVSPEAHSCVMGLLENDPKKRLGSHDSSHGWIREHPFFKSGHRIDWQAIDEGVFKPAYKASTITSIESDTSNHRLLSIEQLDKNISAKAEWLSIGKSAYTSAVDERFKAFDYINQLSCSEFI